MKIKVIICIILLALINFIVYITFGPVYSWGILYRCTVFFSFYSIQLLLLHYVIRLKNKFIYLFPFHWGIEILRILYNSIIRQNYIYKDNEILRFLLIYVTGPFWIASDYVPLVSNHSVTFYDDGFPVSMFGDDVLKLIISILMFIISIKFTLNLCKKHKA